jgi:hypothetical protein
MGDSIVFIFADVGAKERQIIQGGRLLFDRESRVRDEDDFEGL